MHSQASRWLSRILTLLIFALAISPHAADAQKTKKKPAPKPKSKKTAVKPGGANQLEGMRGKIGDMLFDGKWRFQVISMETPEKYEAARQADIQADYSVYSPVAEWDAQRTITPKEGNTLVVFRCLVKNAVPKPRALYCVPAFTRTALTDMDGASHPVIAYDMPGSVFQSRTITQGGTLRFAALFAVPKEAKLKDLIFTLRTIEGGLKDGSDVRVSLPK